MRAIYILNVSIISQMQSSKEPHVPDPCSRAYPVVYTPWTIHRRTHPIEHTPRCVMVLFYSVCSLRFLQHPSPPYISCMICYNMFNVIWGNTNNTDQSQCRFDRIILLSYIIILTPIISNILTPIISNILVKLFSGRQS